MNSTQPPNEVDKIDYYKASFNERVEIVKKLAVVSGQMLFISALSAPFERFKIISQLRPYLYFYGYTGINSFSEIFNKIKGTGHLQFFKGTRIIFYKMFFFNLLHGKLFFGISNLINRDSTGTTNDISNRMLVGVALGILTQFFLYPLDLLKTKQMAEIEPKSRILYKRCFWSFQTISAT